MNKSSFGSVLNISMMCLNSKESSTIFSSNSILSSLDFKNGILDACSFNALGVNKPIMIFLLTGLKFSSNSEMAM